ncbi:hypothetical protein AALP_AA7G160300 [Arabis alpina]|uniref:Transmembrane protein n=1 Tax=Arabis alpina TaxID=50452 RepID=A0A087GIE3_ARAAL|nr:hypothetical protein AALP_AA7G160300 [Arabis alpina]
MKTSSLLGWFLIISLLLISQSLIVSCEHHGTTIVPLGGRKALEHAENADESHRHHHDNLRVFMKKTKKKKKKSSATRALLSSPLTYLSTVVSSFVLVLAAF